MKAFVLFYYLKGTKNNKNVSLCIPDYDLEQIVEKKINDVKSFNNSIRNIKKMITSLKDENNKSRKNYKNSKNLNTLLKPLDSILIIGATLTSLSLSITCVD